MWFLRSSFIAVFICYISLVTSLDFGYHRYSQMVQFLRNFTAKNSNLARLYSIGKSMQGKELYVVELSAVDRNAIAVPNVKLIGNIHGNEAVGKEILLHFLEFLAADYENNSTISWFLNNTRLHILPSLNPDGFEIASEGLCDYGQGRGNANGSDLNRSFPDIFRQNSNKTQVETEAVLKWMEDTPFILSASLHGGALVANYPYENFKENVALPPTRPPSVTPDDDVFQSLARLYANKHPKMHLGEPCKRGEKGFEGGVTNGAAWYTVTGGMQDYNYAFHGCMEITLEISCCKYPYGRELPELWEENKLALLEYVMQAHIGVRGQILDALTDQPIAGADLKILGRDMIFHSSRNGEFWRLLLPNPYILEIKHKDYEPQKISFVIPIQKPNTLPQTKNLTINLFPKGYMTTFSYPKSTKPSSTVLAQVEDENQTNINRTPKIIYKTDDLFGQTAAVIQNSSIILENSFCMVCFCLFAILNLK